jgi:radical SAM protein with 4Fe4S-binding SPASM domain
MSKSKKYRSSEKFKKSDSQIKYRSSEKFKKNRREYHQNRLLSMTPKQKEAWLAARSAARKPLTELQKARQKINMLEWRQNQINNGLCLSCKGVATCGLHCDKHWLRTIGSKYGLTIKNNGVQMLQQLWDEQKGICSITGEKLIRGVNASIDHKIPISRGGTHSKENLHWVTISVNTAKGGQLLEEFIDMCTKVVSRVNKRVVHLQEVKG